MTDGRKSPQALQERRLVINGQTYTLRFHLLALATLCDTWELDSERDVSARLSRRRAADIPVLLWALCRRHHPDMSLQEAQQLADDADLEQLGTAITDTITAGSPQAKKKPEPEADQVANPNPNPSQ